MERFPRARCRENSEARASRGGKSRVYILKLQHKISLRGCKFERHLIDLIGFKKDKDHI